MFRKMALKKGHIKPIHAQTGIMVGQPYSGAPVPAIRKPPTFMERMAVSGPARFLASGVSIPAVGGYIAGETLAKGFGFDEAFTSSLISSFEIISLSLGVNC